MAAGDNAPLSGEFHYIDRWHDPYQKRILGVEFRANAGPMEDGEKLLDMLARHPGTARFVCAKICRRLLADEPPASLVDKAAKVWSENVDAPDQIAKVVRAIALSPEFAEAPPQKLKRPFEFMASFYRAVGAEVASPPLDFIWTLSQAGWNQHECRPPTGHADSAEHWANTNLVSGFINMALNALEDWNGAAKLDLAAATPCVEQPLTRVRLWAAQLHGSAPPDEAVSLIAAQLAGDAGAALPDDPGEREQLSARHRGRRRALPAIPVPLRHAMSDPILVVIFLRGGADGLSLISPSGDKDYAAARPSDLRVARKGENAGFVLKNANADADFRFHPRAKGLSELYDSGELAVVHAAGLRDATRSHFDAEDRMERAAPGQGTSAGGWLGRWMNAVKPEGILPALAVGAAAPDSLRGAQGVAVAEEINALRAAAGHGYSTAIRALLARQLGGDAILGAPVKRLLSL